MDIYGRGNTTWSAGPATVGNTALMRVRANDGSQPTDTSDQGFLIANAGADYYINDNSTAGDVFTSAVGDNANSGKSPDRPMASLTALLAAYDLDSGDVIHLDTGTYSLIKNALITAEDSGVTLRGPSGGPGAVLNRGDTGNSKYVIELQNADNVTMDQSVDHGWLCGDLCDQRLGWSACDQ